MIFKRTAKQKEQTKLLSGPAKHILSYGGSRSAKTFGICRAMAIRAAKTPSRHVALRLKFNHAKTSLFMDTFPKMFNLCFPNLKIHPNKSDFLFQFPNGSEIWIGGLDEAQRVEKILGKEYSTMYFNECSQLPYSSIVIALTRLAEKNELKNKAYYDCNPPTKRHWTYPLFMKGLDPESWEPRPDADKYDSILMNPNDNLENIDEDYISLLEQLPEKDKQRFLKGEFTDESNGNIYYSFDRENNVEDLVRNQNYPLIFGMDFNINPMTASVCQIIEDTIYVIDEIYLENSNTNEMAEEIRRKYAGKWTIIPDSTGKRTQTSSAGLSDHQILEDAGFEIPFVQNPFRMDRYNCVNNLLQKKRLVIGSNCVKLIRDLEQVSYKEGTNLPDTKEKHLTHSSDGLGYLCNWAFPIYDFEGTETFASIKR